MKHMLSDESCKEACSHPGSLLLGRKHLRVQMALKSSRGEQLVNTASVYRMGRRRSAPPRAVLRGGRPCAIHCSHSDHKTRSCGLGRALACAVVDGCTAVLCGKENSPLKSLAYRAGPFSVSQAHSPQGLEARPRVALAEGSWGEQEALLSPFKPFLNHGSSSCFCQESSLLGLLYAQLSTGQDLSLNELIFIWLFTALVPYLLFI